MTEHGFEGVLINGTGNMALMAYLFAYSGLPVYVAGRTHEKSEDVLERARDRALSFSPGGVTKNMFAGTYDGGFSDGRSYQDVASSPNMFIGEVVSEDMEIKRAVQALWREHIHPTSVEFSGSSGILADDIAGESTRSLIVHPFNPVGRNRLCEVVVSTNLDEDVLPRVQALLEHGAHPTFDIIYPASVPNFLGNSVGFHQDALAIAEMWGQYGVVGTDTLINGQIGRSTPPGKLFDFVQLDTSVAICENGLSLGSIGDVQWENPFANDYQLPEILVTLVREYKAALDGGEKPNKPSIYHRKSGQVLTDFDAEGDSRYESKRRYEQPEFLRKMDEHIREGHYEDSFDLLARETGEEAIAVQKALAKYVAHAYSLVDAGVATREAVEIAMGCGWKREPPQGIVLLNGVDRTREMIRDLGLPIPDALSQVKSFDDAYLQPGTPGTYITATPMRN